MKAKDHISFALLDFKNIMGILFEGAMSMPFYNPFLMKFVEYASPRMKELDVWMWHEEYTQCGHVDAPKGYCLCVGVTKYTEGMSILYTSFVNILGILFIPPN